MTQIMDHFRIAEKGERQARACRFLQEVGASYQGWSGLWVVPTGVISEDEERSHGLVRADSPDVRTFLETSR